MLAWDRVVAFNDGQRVLDHREATPEGEQVAVAHFQEIHPRDRGLVALIEEVEAPRLFVELSAQSVGAMERFQGVEATAQVLDAMAQRGETGVEPLDAMAQRGVTGVEALAKLVVPLKQRAVEGDLGLEHGTEEASEQPTRRHEQATAAFGVLNALIVEFKIHHQVGSDHPTTRRRGQPFESGRVKTDSRVSMSSLVSAR
jgi:hypothetical protein